MTTRKLTKRRTLIAAGLGLAIIAFAGMALAQGPGTGRGQGKGMQQGMHQGIHQGMGEGFGPGHRLEMMAARLDLTDEQKASIEKIHDAAQEQRMETRKEMMRLRNELEGELMKDEPSENKALELTGKIGDLRTAQQKSRLSTRLAVQEQLTPEQRDKMLMMHAGGRGHGRHGDAGFGKGHGRGCDQGQGRGYGRHGGDGPWDKD